MQCARCGYFNTETVESCIKCNTPLTKEKSDTGGRKTQAIPQNHEIDDYLNKTILEKSDMGIGSDGNFSASKTVAEKTGDGRNQNFSASKTVADFNTARESSEQDKTGDAPKVELIPCPSCNYPVSGDVKFCPSCSHVLSQPVNTGVPKSIKQKPVSMKERKAQKTVNIFAMDEGVKEEKIVLTEIKQSGSREIELTSEGMKISLNKETLQQEDNPAISSNTHAELLNFEGDWFVVNRSSAGTTFVAVSKPHKLSKNDVILVGDSMYRFKG